MSSDRVTGDSVAGFQRKPLTIRRIAEEFCAERDGSETKHHDIEVTVSFVKSVFKFLAPLKDQARTWNKLFDDKTFRTQLGWYTFLDEFVKQDETCVKGSLTHGDFDTYFDNPVYRRVMSTLFLKIGCKSQEKKQKRWVLCRFGINNIFNTSSCSFPWIKFIL